MTETIDHHAALIYTMVLVSAAEGRMSDAELASMTAIVQSLPVFRDFDRSRINAIGADCVELLKREDGLDVALAHVKAALPKPLRETAYALALEVIAADARASQDELRMLELIRDRLKIERLVAAGIERGAQARFRTA
jgi:tellurite resistance protein